ncbi:hypothetical protein HMPREF3232_01063 [Fannyhessea vaginae]|nr:hypothetical protein HMPREF3232_01063 [Fannyhessea vaginae]
MCKIMNTYYETHQAGIRHIPIHIIACKYASLPACIFVLMHT